MKQNNKKFNNAMHKFVGVLDKYGKLAVSMSFKSSGQTTRICFCGSSPVCQLLFMEY